MNMLRGKPAKQYEHLEAGRGTAETNAVKITKPRRRVVSCGIKEGEEKERRWL